MTVADDLTAKYPAAWPARVTITLEDGTICHAARATIPRGNPENPVSTAELEDKFLALVAPRFGRKPRAARSKPFTHSKRADDMAEAIPQIL